MNYDFCNFAIFTIHTKNVPGVEGREVGGIGQSGLLQLTPYCKEFCEKNEAATNEAMERIFRDISEEALAVTIRTISKMERNVQTL